MSLSETFYVQWDHTMSICRNFQADCSLIMSRIYPNNYTTEHWTWNLDQLTWQRNFKSAPSSKIYFPESGLSIIFTLGGAVNNKKWHKTKYFNKILKKTFNFNHVCLFHGILGGNLTCKFSCIFIPNDLKIY